MNFIFEFLRVRKEMLFNNYDATLFLRCNEVLNLFESANYKLYILRIQMIFMRNGKMNWEELNAYIKEARKDPQFRKDLKKFLDITTGKSK